MVRQRINQRVSWKATCRAPQLAAHGGQPHAEHFGESKRDVSNGSGDVGRAVGHYFDKRLTASRFSGVRTRTAISSGATLSKAWSSGERMFHNPVVSLE